MDGIVVGHVLVYLVVGSRATEKPCFILGAFVVFEEVSCLLYLMHQVADTTIP